MTGRPTRLPGYPCPSWFGFLVQGKAMVRADNGIVHRSLETNRKTASRLTGAGFLLFLFLAPALPAASDEAGAQAPVYRLSAGDRVTINIFGQPDLSGEYLIDAAGTITMPLIGSFAAADSTVGEVQQRVVDHFADGYLQDPVVSVRINELRPLYLIGDVKLPGSYPFRYGLTVTSAIALAGGPSLSVREQEVLRSEFLQADERLKVLQVNHQAMTARRARLKAQLDSADDIVLPEGFRTDTPELAALVAGEREILRFQARTQEQEVELLAQQIPQLDSEAQALRAQAVLEEEQISLLQGQIDDYTSLLNSGLTRRATLVDVQREQAKSRAVLARLQADIAKSEIALAQIRIRLQESENGYQRRLMTELQETDLRLLELGGSIPSAKEARDTKALQASAGAMQSSGGDMYRNVRINRFRDGQMVTLQATLSMTLEPGDIVQVSAAPLGAVDETAAIPPEPQAVSEPEADLGF